MSQHGTEPADPDAAEPPPADREGADEVPQPDVAVDVPEGADVERCPRCDRPFLGERQRDLHLGEAHGDLTDEQAAAYEAAVEAEDDDLFFFHMKVVVTLGVLYSSTVLLYTAIVGFTG